MKRTSFILTAIVIMLALSLTTCSKGGAPTTEPTDTGAGETKTPLELGADALKARDIASAKNIYCSALEGTSAMTTKDSGGGTPATGICFGCAMTRFFELWESEPVQTIIQAFGERRLAVQADLFNDGGVFDRVMKRRDNITNPDGTPICLNDLPFMASSKCGEFLYEAGGTRYYRDTLRPYAKPLVTKMLCSLKSNSVPFDTIRTNFASIAAELQAIDGILQPALSDTSFTFTIPKDLFRTRTDHPITVDDLNMFSAGLNLGVFFLGLAQAYDPGIDPQKICQADKIIRDIALEDLNGSGGTVGGVTVDSIPIATLLDETKVKNLRPVYDAFVNKTLAGLTGVRDHGSSLLWENFLNGLKIDIYNTLRGNGHHSFTDIIDRAISLFNEFKAMSTGFSPILNYPGRRLQINMDGFFTTPPDGVKAADVSSSYPFVLEDRCRLYGSCDRFPFDAVELFWNEFTRGIATR